MQSNMPFLIVGAGSSGTTLLSVLLDKHPEIRCGPEISVFNKAQIYLSYKHLRSSLAVWLDRGLSTDGQAEYRNFFSNLEAYGFTKEELLEHAENCDCYREFFNGFFRRSMEVRQKRIWGEKTGSNAYCISSFLSIFPEARVVHLLRDGRDAVCSLMKRGGSPYHAVSHWLYNVNAALQWRNYPGYYEMRYEKLVSEPRSEISKLLDHLNVEFEESIFDSARGSSWQDYQMGNIHHSWNNSPIGEAVNSSSVGRYKSDLSLEVFSLFSQVKLCPFTRKRLNTSYRTAAQLLVGSGYCESDEPFPALAEPRLIWQGVTEWKSRFAREFRYNRKVWLPLTWANPFGG